MKKSIIFILIFLCILVIYELLFNFLKSSHEIVYNIINDDITFEVSENYVRNVDDDYYYLQVNEKDSDDSFIFYVKNEYNKRKNIVKSVNIYKKDSVSCMNLVLVDSRLSEGVCIKNNSLYSYYSLKDELNISELNSNLKYYTRKVDIENYDEIDVEIKYLDENELLIFHLPKEMVIFDYEKSHHFTFASKDNYKNKYGILVNNYYIIPRINVDTEFDTFLMYDLNSYRVDSLALQTNISINSYNNGVYNSELYITDVSNLRQYKINPVVKSIQLVGNSEEDAYLFENDKAKRVNIYEITSKELKFTKTNELYNGIDYDQIFINEGYAYYVKDGKFYKVYEKYKDRPIYLFKANNPVNIIEKNNTIYYIEYNQLKKFNDKGINVLLTFDELINNYDNIFDVYIRK